MIYDVLDIAEYIIKRGWELGDCINCLKLQKILYFVQAYFLIATNYPCFDEKIEAWAFGPVIPVAYKKYIIFGNGSIPEEDIVQDFDYIEENDKKLIDAAIQLLLPYSSVLLTDLIQKQSPWMDAIEKGDFAEITNESIKEYFLS